MKTRELRERFLVALYLEGLKKGLENYMDAKRVANAAKLERAPGQLALIYNDLEGHGYIRTSRTFGTGEEDSGLGLQLTGSGVEQAEELLEAHPDYARTIDAPTAPASDRYVALSDNQRIEVGEDIERLTLAVKAANKVEDEERQIALSEIAAFEATIAQSRISVELIDRFVGRILVWIRKTFGEALVGAVAGALISKLLPFLAS